MAGLVPRLALVSLVLGLLVGATAGTAAAASCAGAAAPATKAKREQVRDAGLCLVNAERAKKGLDSLRMSSRLRRAARDHSEHMVKRRYFAHESPNGLDMVERAKRRGYPKGSWTLAENIAYGMGPRSSPARIVKGWMASPLHRANILLDDVRDAGVGVAFKTPDGDTGATYTLVLGRRGG